MLAGAALAAGGIGSWGPSRADGYTLESVVTELCDRMVPALGEHPGAVALGVHRSLIDDLERRWRPADQRTLVDIMRRARFLELPVADRDAALLRMLDDPEQPALTRVLASILHVTVRLYLGDAGSWAALGYRKPQPLGYPDYARCAGAANTGQAS